MKKLRVSALVTFCSLIDQSARARHVPLGVKKQIGHDEANTPTRSQHPVALLQHAPRLPRRDVLQEVRGIDLVDARSEVGNSPSELAPPHARPIRLDVMSPQPTRAKERGPQPRQAREPYGRGIVQVLEARPPTRAASQVQKKTTRGVASFVEHRSFYQSARLALESSFDDTNGCGFLDIDLTR